MAAKSSIVVMKTLTLRTFCRLLPASSRTACRFLSACLYVDDGDLSVGWLILLQEEMLRGGGESLAHRPVLDGPVDDLGRLRVDANVAGAVDHAVELDGLRELGERLGSLLREDGLDLAHVVVWRVSLDGLDGLEEEYRKPQENGLLTEPVLYGLTEAQ